MATFIATAALDAELNYVKTNASKIFVLKAYAAGDSSATITTNKLAEVAVTSADYTLSNSGNNRVLTVAAKSTSNSTATLAAGSDLHVAHVDASGNALWVTNETTDQAVTTGNPFDIPSHAITANQPT
jgi:hypothetical protein